MNTAVTDELELDCIVNLREEIEWELRGEPRPKETEQERALRDLGECQDEFDRAEWRLDEAKTRLAALEQEDGLE